MKALSRKTHGVLDYVVGVLLIAAPWIFGFARGGAETLVPVASGAAAIIYSLLTDYEMGAVRKLSMRTHLTLDTLSGVMMALSPWIFGFADHVYLPHLLFGVGEIAVVLITDPAPAQVSRDTNGDPTHRHAH